MTSVSTIGLDLAKSVFQIHGIDAEGQAVMKRRLRRQELLAFFERLEPCLVAMEACSSAHHWARELVALGHDVRLIPPQYAKPYVKRNKTDAADAEAICEAAGRPTMRFVPIKTRESQALLALHRVRSLLVRQRTAAVNSARGLLGEFGLVAPKGIQRVRELRSRMEEAGESVLPPGVGPLTATALVAAIGDGAQFQSARHFAAWLGLTPRISASGGREHIGRISKGGDRYLRTLLIHGARAMVGTAFRQKAKPRPWLQALMARRPINVAAVAVAHKTARVLWAMLRQGEVYRRPDSLEAAA